MAVPKGREAVFSLPSRAGTVPTFYYTEDFARVPTPKGQKGGKKKNFLIPTLFFSRKGEKTGKIRPRKACKKESPTEVRPSFLLLFVSLFLCAYFFFVNNALIFVPMVLKKSATL